MVTFRREEEELVVFQTSRRCTYLRGHLPVWTAVAVLQLHVGFFVDPVQVFVETIQQKSQQLLGVLLLEAIKPRRVLGYGPLERKTSHTQGSMQIKPSRLAGRRGRAELTLSLSGATLFWVPLHSSITKSP